MDGSATINTSSNPLSSQNAQSAQQAGSERRSAEDERRINELNARDREVRAHEQAHLAAAGAHARGGIQFSYTRGPDQRLYATGGEVSIDTAPVRGDPQATLQKAQTIRRAALAPAQPSAQDRAVAAQAAQMATEARAELAAERRAALEEVSPQSADETAAGNEIPHCPACGGAHAAAAHEGLSAYAAQSLAEAPDAQTFSRAV
ncbi:MAG: putative metalloprotease CJM1_0395 family protein [Pseudomonadota bacterium]